MKAAYDAEIEQRKAKLAALVEAAKKHSITANYLCLDLQGHGFKLADQLKEETLKLKAALDAVK